MATKSNRFRPRDDEMRHANLALLVAQRYATQNLPPWQSLTLQLPAHDTDVRTKKVLHVIAQGCLNETIASQVLEACLQVSSSPFARAAVRELLTDEIEHARIGWAFLANLNEPERNAVQRWLAGLIQANVATWLKTPRSYSTDEMVLSHGTISKPLLQNAVRAAVTGLIIPGFQQMGFDTINVEAWVRSGMNIESIKVLR